MCPICCSGRMTDFHPQGIERQNLNFRWCAAPACFRMRKAIARRKLESRGREPWERGLVSPSRQRNANRPRDVTITPAYVSRVIWLIDIPIPSRTGSRERERREICENSILRVITRNLLAYFISSVHVWHSTIVVDIFNWASNRRKRCAKDNSAT